MLRPVTLTLLLSLSALLVSDCSSPTAPVATGPADEAAVSRADSAEVRAFVANDPVALARLWSDDFVVTNPFNQFVNKPQVLALVTSGTLAFRAYERHIEYTHAYGDLVLVAGTETVVWAGRIPLAGQTSRLRYTSLWRRTGADWQEVARHATLVAPCAPAGPPIGG